MTLLAKSLTLAAVFAVAFALGAEADFDAGVAAYRRGDFDTALFEFTPLAEAGDAIAQFTLGYMHQFGEGVPRSDAQAARWYALAAEQGHPLAQYNLGILYQDGRGVAQDNVTAYMWLDLAASAGALFAGPSRSAVARLMTPPEIAEAQRRVREWRAGRR
jgi:TPR repeat protein